MKRNIKGLTEAEVEESRRINGDNSLDILLYGVMTLLLMLVFVFVWRMVQILI